MRKSEKVERGKSEGNKEGNENETHTQKYL